MVFSDLKEYSKAAGQFPTDDYDYHEAFPRFRNDVKEHSAFLIELMDSCGQLLPKSRQIKLKEEQVEKGGVPTLSVAQRASVMDAIDSLLENVDSVLDEIKGKKLTGDQQLAVSFGEELNYSKVTNTGEDAGVLRQGNVMRPQLTFDVPVDNSAEPFIPHYCDRNGKAHVGKPSVHPFEKEIKEFTFPEDQFIHKNDIPYVPLDSCPLRFINTVEGLSAAVEELLQATEIAVDLEHHDTYSYQGFTCLMQISTRTTDYIIDCIKLRSNMGLLAPVFLNGKILKVFHGAREDVRWLQKDFGLYLINFFDTSLALQALHMPYSLAFAVDHFCQIKLNKRFQTADWRVRPLPSEMVHYARQDTHYLLYIYDRLKSLLLNSEAKASVGNLLRHVYQESKLTSLDRYEKPINDSEQSYAVALGRSLGGLSNLQKRVARDIYNWRDSVARSVDDSPTAVLHLSSVLSIACKLPTTAREVLACASPVSAVLRKEVGKLVEIIPKAIEELGGEDAISGVGKERVNGPADGSGSSVKGFIRTVQSHRPMTGTLASIAVSVSPSLSTPALTDQVTWKDSTPSLWFNSLRALGKDNRARVAPQVSLPGADVLKESEERKKAAAKAAAEAAAGVQEAPKAFKRRRDSDDDDEEKPTVDNEEETEPPVNDEDAVVQSKKAKYSEENGAIAIRQVYGVGNNARKGKKKK
ncbi:PMC2NT (NUC016) domain/3'-5' exonuclease/HRDC domain containing protein, putative [Angomonas deanei]|uniref:PMC2NT (NUC016) domain/3'-5' exonuclease/HRDC domain containing protein, putative n=1 Tax=Angomonas deanei TaxID=59799 RepID=A0A7G2C585_9TRYP|nr:PMC2NT (NUC016) domain/3'-5' exonuclease/HRDC domain containing protein, putative [Angomonas deanei]